MKISTEILEHEIWDEKKEPIIFSNIVHDRNMKLERVKLLSCDSDENYESDSVYVCGSADLPESDRLGNGCCVVCAGLPRAAKLENYKNVNILVVDNPDFAHLGNIVISIFEKYNNMEKEISEHFSASKQIGDKTMDIFSKIIGMPLCMMDANYNSFAFSRTVTPIDDKLWDYLVKGYGYHYYDIVCKSIPRLEDVAKSENGEVETINNIGGHCLRVKAIYSSGVPIAFLGMHNINKRDKSFNTYTVQLFDYVVDCLQKNANLLKNIQRSRGKVHEQFLEDMLGGKEVSSDNLAECMKVADVPTGDFYMLGIVYFDSDNPEAYNHIAMMDYIEGMYSTSKCVKYENHVVVLTALKREEVFENKIKICASSMLTQLLNNCNARAIFSWPYEDVKDSTYIYKQLEYVKDMDIIKDNNIAITCYDKYSTAIIMNQMQNMHIIGVLGNATISKLSYYDKINNTELYLTCKQYLKNKCSIAITADVMHLHRNTLQYRLKQIETLTNIDFNDADLRSRLMYAIDATDYMDSLSKE